jgi:HPt (histidine-containing phosphotransfer) domain-containing protein
VNSLRNNLEGGRFHENFTSSSEESHDVSLQTPVAMLPTTIAMPVVSRLLRPRNRQGSMWRWQYESLSGSIATSFYKEVAMKKRISAARSQSSSTIGSSSVHCGGVVSSAESASPIRSLVVVHSDDHTERLAPCDIADVGAANSEHFSTLETKSPSVDDITTLPLAVNTNQLTELLAAFAGKRTLLMDVLEITREELPRMLEPLHIAIEQKDSQRVHFAAHAIRGSVRHFPAESIVRITMQLEEYARQEDFVMAAAAYAELSSAVAELLVYTHELQALLAAELQA